MLPGSDHGFKDRDRDHVGSPLDESEHMSPVRHLPVSGHLFFVSINWPRARRGMAVVVARGGPTAGRRSRALTTSEATVVRPCSRDCHDTQGMERQWGWNRIVQVLGSVRSGSFFEGRPRMKLALSLLLF